MGTGELGTLGGQYPGGRGVRNSPSRAGIRGDWRTRDPGCQGPLGDTPGVGGTSLTLARRYPWGLENSGPWAPGPPRGHPGGGGYVTHPRAQVSVGTGELGKDVVDEHRLRLRLVDLLLKTGRTTTTSVKNIDRPSAFVSARLYTLLLRRHLAIL